MSKKDKSPYVEPDDINCQPFAYETTQVEDRKYGMKIFEGHIWPLISFCFTGNEEVLDLGCGTGRHSKFLSSFAKNITAIDIAPSHIVKDKAGYDMRLIKDIPNVEYINANFMNYDGQKKFDVVFIHSAFYYFYKCYQEDAFKKIISFLKSKNSLVVLIDGQENYRRPPLNRHQYDLHELSEKYNMECLVEEVKPQWGSTGARVSVLKLQ